jgi:hypothetical protein
MVRIPPLAFGAAARRRAFRPDRHNCRPLSPLRNRHQRDHCRRPGNRARQANTAPQGNMTRTSFGDGLRFEPRSAIQQRLHGYELVDLLKNLTAASSLSRACLRHKRHPRQGLIDRWPSQTLSTRHLSACQFCAFGVAQFSAYDLSSRGHRQRCNEFDVSGYFMLG